MRGGNSEGWDDDNDDTGYDTKDKKDTNNDDK